MFNTKSPGSGNAFCVTGPFWEWIHPVEKASSVGFHIFCCQPKQTVEQTIDIPVNWDTMTPMRRHWMVVWNNVIMAWIFVHHGDVYFFYLCLIHVIIVAYPLGTGVTSFSLAMLKFLLVDGNLITWLLIGWQPCCRPIRSYVCYLKRITFIKTMLTEE